MSKRANGDGTITKRTVNRNGKIYSYWEGRLTIGINPGTGKQIRKSFTGKTQKEVREKMQAAAVTVNEGQYFEASNLTIKEWFDIWLADYMAAVKPLTVQQYKSMSETHIIPAIGAVKLSKITAPQLQKFYNELAKTGKTVRRKNPKSGKMEIVSTGEPLSAKSIKNIHGILSKALNTAVNQGLIRDNPAKRVTIPKIIKEEVQPLTEEQQKAFISALKTHKFKNLFIVIMFTGLREGEAIGLTWDCIDLQKGTLKVYRQLQRTPDKWSVFRFVPLKNSKTRTIKLSSYIINVLQQQKTQQKLDKLAAGETWKGFQRLEDQETDFVFTDSLGEHLKSVTVYNNFKKLAAEIGKPDARVHDLRHTFAVISLQNGDDFKTVQDALGHATAAFTLDVYGHVSERMMEEHAARQQDYIEALGI